MQNFERKVTAIIEARMTSSRLPGKHLLEVCGKPIIGHLIARLKSVPSIDEIVVAMTERSNDDPLDAFVKDLGVEVFRGDENDVMGRVLNAAQNNGADIICEVTGDCPIIDPVLIEQALQVYLLNQASYVNNGRYGLPDGMGCQIFSTQDLALSAMLTNDPLDREHVTLHIKRNPDLFPPIYIPALMPYRWPELAVTLDERSDYLLIKKITEHFGDNNSLFGCVEVIQLLKQKPEWACINHSVMRRGNS